MSGRGEVSETERRRGGHVGSIRVRARGMVHEGESGISNGPFMLGVRKQ